MKSIVKRFIQNIKDLTFSYSAYKKSFLCCRLNCIRRAHSLPKLSASQYFLFLKERCDESSNAENMTLPVVMNWKEFLLSFE